MGRTIRTCSALGLILFAVTAETAVAAQQIATPWRAYMHGRAAINQDQLSEASRQFQIALKANSDNRMLQQRTFGIALLSGNEKLSYALAQQLESAGSSAFDTRIVLLGAAIQKRDWASAKAVRKALSEQNQILFALPIIDAWLAFGSKNDALMHVSNIGRDALSNSYVSEHRAFLLGAMGKIDEALVEYQPLIAGESARATRMRLVAAAMLQRAGRKADALNILAGNNPALKSARAQVNAGRRLETGIFTPAEGIAELFARLAADASRDSPSQVSLSIARMATFLAPRNAEGWIVTATILANDGRPQTALEALSHIAPTDPFASQATSFRINLLQRLDRSAEALGIAQAAVTRADVDELEWSQLGDALSATENYADAAAAYGKALSFNPAADRIWQLHLLRGGAYERMGDWQRAEPDLRRAVALAPDQAITLNYLGYGLLDRGLNLDEAQSLIEKASALRPQDGAIMDSLAWAHFRRGSYKRAIELLEQAVRLEPGEPTINEHLGDVYWQVGRKMEARFSWRAAMVGTEERPALDRLKRKIDFGPEGDYRRNP